MKYLLSILCCIFLVPFKSLAQSLPAAEILENIKKLNVLGSVMYIAAHPDDENTRLISFLSKDQKFRTAYVSLTRGDGGQNLIGQELDEYLGVIRTNELLEARKIDGGIQYFTRANDFGFSKNAEETFSIWNKDSLVFDLVRIIREFQPDVIINRFDHRTSGKTHGHHTASAILSEEAFKLSGSALYRREELTNLEPIIIPRLFFNTSYFFYGSKEKFDAADKSGLYSLNVGSYYPASGLSNGEISAQSRSMHKSQGFGINSSRGSQMEYFERIDKSKDSDHVSPFDGLDLSWTRINGGGNISKIINQVIQEYNINNPSSSILLLQKAEKYIEELSPGHWRDIKLKEIREIILQCAGVFAEATTDQLTVANLNSMKLNVEFIARNYTNIILQSIKIQPINVDTLIDTKLALNVPFFWKKEVQLQNLNLTSPFWLLHGRNKSTYTVDSTFNFSDPVTARQLKVDFSIKLNDRQYTITKEIIYKNDDPVLGEIKQPLNVLPNLTIDHYDPNTLILDKKGSIVKFVVRSWAVGTKGILKLNLPPNFKCNPKEIYLSLNKNEKKEVEFLIVPDALNNKTKILPVEFNGSNCWMHTEIKYSHIPWQNVLTPAIVRLVALDLKITPKSVAYITGAGDETDEMLRKIGYKVTEIHPADLGNLNVDQTPVLIFGIRAWNTREDLPQYKKELLNFVVNGGKVIFQYNTTAELLLGDALGSDFKISRDRITNESSPVKFLDPNHPILNFPNKITLDDFNDWVQERGLYFPSEYGKDWKELIAMNDPNENELKSGVLVKSMGKGSIIYSPISWFRQLPAGVPGAYRLFVNLISF